MTDMVKLPGVGPVKKVYAIAGVGIIGGVLVYAYWKRQQAPPVDQTEPTPTDTSTTGTATSGYVEDSTAAGYNMVYPSAYSGGYSPYGYGMYGNPLPPPVSSGSNGPYTTNADWATAAESALENANVSLATSTLAISRVLGGLSVTSSQKDLFMQAVGILGQPPQGYPTPIKLTDSGSGTPTPTPGGPLKAPTGLKVTHVDRTHVSLSWSKVSGATHYRVYRSDVAQNVGDSIDNSTTIGGLSHNHTYHLHVRAVDSHGHLGASSASIAVRTKK